VDGKRTGRPVVAADTPQARLEAIWRVVAALPPGAVDTYGGVAARAGLPRAARLVGHALRVAPAELRLPWHRVVAAGGRIAVPAGSAVFREQQRRLRAEGVEVVGGRVTLAATADLDALLWGDVR
jgi:methylated-DNA-protein-cysteine methyltransferase related protein